MSKTVLWVYPTQEVFATLKKDDKCARPRCSALNQCDSDSSWTPTKPSTA